jgi:hypothetical protein
LAHWPPCSGCQPMYSTRFCSSASVSVIG